MTYWLRPTHARPHASAAALVIMALMLSAPLSAQTCRGRPMDGRLVHVGGTGSTWSSGNRVAGLAVLRIGFVHVEGSYGTVAPGLGQVEGDASEVGGRLTVDAPANDRVHVCAHIGASKFEGDARDPNFPGRLPDIAFDGNTWTVGGSLAVAVARNPTVEYGVFGGIQVRSVEQQYRLFGSFDTIDRERGPAVELGGFVSTLGRRFLMNIAVTLGAEPEGTVLSGGLGFSL